MKPRPPSARGAGRMRAFPAQPFAVRSSMPLFKNIVVFRIGPEWTVPPLERLESELQRLAFTPCQPTQELSAGWVPPRGKEHGAMVEIVDGQWILQLAVERKAVPGGAVRAELEARCKALEAERGR